MLILNKKYKKLKNLLIISFVFFILLPTLGLGLFAFFTTETLISRKIAESTINSISQINLSIEKDAWNIDELLDRIIMNEQLQDIIAHTDFKTFDSKLRDTCTILNRIIDEALVSSKIKNNVNILIISLDKGFYWFNEKIYLDESEIRNSKWYSDSIELGGRLNWHGMSKSRSIINCNSYVFEASRAIISIKSFKMIGVIYFSVDESIFQPLFNQFPSSQSFYVINSDMEILMSSDKTMPDPEVEFKSFIRPDNQQPGSFRKKIDRQDYLFVYSNPNRYGWRVVSKIPLKTLTGEIDRIKVWTFIALTLCISISLYFLKEIFKKITKPLQQLVNFINEIESSSKTINLQRFPCYELLKIGNGIISLVEKNKNTVQKLQKTEVLYQKTHLEKLEAQINPHFLYNTLNSIKFIAMENNQETISDLITSFTKLLRNCINTNVIMVKVSEELENLNHYIKIQNVTYKNKIHFCFEVDGNISDYMIPRFILQPLVENSIIHGIRRESGHNVITIRGYKERDDLVFEVEDNGKGMDSEKIDLIMNSSGSKENFSRFGIRGIKERLELLYGSNNCSMIIESRENLGTKTVIRIPVMLKNDIEELVV